MKRIVVVDDEPLAAAGLRTLLELDGYTVAALQSSEEAARLLTHEPFDVLITDLEMPVLHGTQLVRLARSARRDAIVFVLTGYADSPAAADALQAGARRVFVKPLDYDLLAAELRELDGG